MIFHHKPQYSQEQINQQVANLEKLNKLRDMVFQKMIISNDDQFERWKAEMVRYDRNIESGQRMLDFMQMKNVGKG